MTFSPRTVAIAGLGLIGGSLARDLSARGCRVLAADRNPDTLRAALQAGAVHEALAEGLENLPLADLAVLAVPVTAATALLESWAHALGPDAVVTDAGSTKESIVRAAESFGLAERFVGSHPLAGSHRSGWDASQAGLFVGARVFLTPTPHTSPAATGTVERFWAELGARPEVIDAAEHDRRLAWSSHLPQAAATVLARALAEAGVPRGDLGPGGRDTVRLAASSPEMWTAICLDNAAALDAALAGVTHSLGELRAAVRDRDEARIEAFFAAARHWSGQG